MEQFLLIDLGDPRSVISDRDFKPPLTVTSSQRDVAPWRGAFDGIPNEIGQHLQEAVMIEGRPRGSIRDGERERTRLAGGNRTK